MCGRYAATRNQSQLVETFEVDDVVGAPRPTPWVAPNWNVAPTDPVAVVHERRDATSSQVRRKLAGMRWGLVPSWSKSPDGVPLINARLETVTTKPSFRKAVASRRCVIPADGYYEWQQVPGSKTKQPHWIHPVSGVMAMAGLYEFWRDPQLPADHDDAWLLSCTIITTSANDELGRLHDRMPVQVLPGAVDAWLDPTMTDAEAALAVLHRPEPGEMTSHPVSSKVNHVRNNGPDLVEPLVG